VDVLKTAALSTGLVAGFLAAFLFALYCLQWILRVVRHWDTSRPLPEIRSWKVGALQVTLTEAGAVQKATATLHEHDERLKRLERLFGILRAQLLEQRRRTR
jgi:hypothetical protein